MAQKALEDLNSAVAAMEAKKAETQKVMEDSKPMWEKAPEDEKVIAHKAQANEQMEKITQMLADTTK